MKNIAPRCSSVQKRNTMKTSFTYWSDGPQWLGYLAEFPDYWTQGDTLDELKKNLVDLWRDLNGGHVPGARHQAELVLA
jgi:hypothetical protein